ncbi:MAG: hypothetical protein ABIH04_10780 [Planctomycetota bacterium]
MLRLYIFLIDRMLSYHLLAGHSGNRWERTYFRFLARLCKYTSFLVIPYSRDRERAVLARTAMMFDLLVGKEKRIGAMGKVEGLDYPLQEDVRENR